MSNQQNLAIFQFIKCPDCGKENVIVEDSAHQTISCDQCSWSRPFSKNGRVLDLLPTKPKDVDKMVKKTSISDFYYEQFQKDVPMQDLNESGWSIVNANSNNRQSFFLSKLKIAVTKVVDMSISNKVLIDLSAVTPAEADHGHRCTYTLDTLERDVVAAGLKVTHRSGIFFKALANFQWDRLLQTDIVSKEYLEGCYQLGQIYPDLCSSIFLMCERN